MTEALCRPEELTHHGDKETREEKESRTRSVVSHSSSGLLAFSVSPRLRGEIRLSILSQSLE